MHSHACEGQVRGRLGSILLPQDLLAMDVWGWCPLLTKHTLSLMTAMIADLNMPWGCNSIPQLHGVGWGKQFPVLLVGGQKYT